MASGNDIRPIYIYALVDPVTDQIRYVGMSVNPSRRLQLHVRDLRGKTHKSCWIAKLKGIGQIPRMVILEECDSDTWKVRERWWIDKLTSDGLRLTNGTRGGDGVLGLKHTPEGKAKMRAAKLGKPLSPEVKALLLGFAGRKHSQETKEKLRQIKLNCSQETRNKLSRALTGKKLSLATRKKISQIKSAQSIEVRKKIAETLRGRKASPETRAKMSATRKGKKLPPRSTEYKSKMSRITRAYYAVKANKNQLPLFLDEAK